MSTSLKQNITRLLWNIVFIYYTIWNISLMFVTIAAFWKFLTHWSTYPQLFRWINLILPKLSLVIVLLGCIGGFLKIVKCILMRNLIMIFAVLYWFELNPLNQIHSFIESGIQAAWTEQMNGNSQAFNIIENFLHCCGINGTDDYKILNMTIPNSCEKYSNQEANGCLYDAFEKYKLEQHDFIAWGTWLWIFITIDILLSSLLIYTILKIRLDRAKLIETTHASGSPLLSEN